MLNAKEVQAARLIANSESSLLSEALQQEIAEIIEQSEIIERAIIKQNIQSSKSII